MKLHTILEGKLYQRGASGKLPAEQKLKTLDDLNVGLVVNLYSERDEDLARYFGEQYLHIPIADGKKAFEGDGFFWFAVQDATRRIRRGEAVLVQCHAGRNRSSLLSALIVRQILSVSGHEAAELVRRQRLGALANQAFLEYLDSLPAPSAVEVA